MVAVTVKTSGCVSDFKTEMRSLADSGTVFQTEHWLTNWCSTIAKHHRVEPLFVLVSLQPNGQPIMLLPLCVKTTYGVKIVSFADCGVSDYNVPLIAPDWCATPEEFDTVWHATCSLLPKFDVFEFDKIPAVIGGKKTPLAMLRGMQPLSLNAWQVELPQSRALYEQRIDRKDRKEHARKYRNLVKAIGAVKLVYAVSPEDTEAMLNDLCRLRRARFKTLGYADILALPHYLEFYRAIADTSDSKAIVATLRSSDRCVAALYAVVFKSQCILLMHSFDEEFEHLSPGIVAIDLLITDLIERGFTVLDLSVGNTPYKRQFAPVLQKLVGGTYANSLKGKVYLGVTGGIQRLREHPKLTVIKQQLKKVIRRR